MEIFLSHVGQDTLFIQNLRQRLEEYGITVRLGVWELMREFLPHRASRSVISVANCFTLVLDPEGRDLRKARRELGLARWITRGRGKVFQPVVLRFPSNRDGEFWSDQEDSPQILTIENNSPKALETILPELLATLNRCLHTDPRPVVSDDIVLRNESLVDELLLTLYNPTLSLNDDRERLRVEATLDYFPTGHAPSPSVWHRFLPKDQEDGYGPNNGHRFHFTVPLNPMEEKDFVWYLEDYPRWPIGEFQRRAQLVEAALPRWGQALYRAALGSENARHAREAWRRAKGNRRFTVLVDTTPSNIASSTERRGNGQRRAFGASSGIKSANSVAATTALVSLPWELLHDGHDYLFQGENPVIIAKLARSYVSNCEERLPAAVDPPVRVLFVCPRPEDDSIPYLDHRQVTQPLAQTLMALGGLAQLTILTPPTLGELEKTLAKARRRRTPYTVVHFDGYGISDRHGALYFEDPKGLDRLERRPGIFVDAEDLAAVLREHRVHIVFLTLGSGGYHQKDEPSLGKKPDATITHDITTTTALRLLRVGINAVITMTHRVPTSTTACFLGAFYSALTRGDTVGIATAKARQALRDTSYHREITEVQMVDSVETVKFGLCDWFVPVLYQDTQDLQPFRRVTEARYTALQTERRVLRLDGLPPSPAHGFYGRSCEMLAVERRFQNASYAVITGPDGIGKTTLAIETARWLVKSGRFERAAFVSLKEHPHPREVLDSLGHQLASDWDASSAITDPQAQQQLERILAEQPTLIILDNASLYLAPVKRKNSIDFDNACLTATSNLQTILDLCRVLCTLTTRLLFTSHEGLPPPYTGHIHPLGLLEENDAIALVAGVLRAHHLVPFSTDLGRTHTELANLVQAAGCYPRAVALIVPALACHGVRATTNKLRMILAEIDSNRATTNKLRMILADSNRAAIHSQETEKTEDQLRHLYAAVVLSLRTLSPESQNRVRILAHFQRIASIEVIAAMLALTPEEATAFGKELIGVELARDLGDGCLGLEPTLPTYLTAATEEHIQATDWDRWLKAMAERLNSLYKAWFRNADLGLRLTRRELPNLLTLLDWSAAHRSAEETLGLVWRLETLLAPLRLPRLLDRVTALRERLAPRFVGWGRAAFAAEAAAVERLLESGWLPEALQQSQALVERATHAGEKAYPGASHDLAMAHRLLSRALDASGTPAPALAHLELARRRFEALAMEGSKLAARMASVCCTERGDCLRALGQLEAAAAAYQEALAADESRGATRDAAVNRLQLADIWRLQGDYPEALILYAQARESFLEIREFSMVAVAWHQIGLIHQDLKDWKTAEAAYKEVLTIWIRRGDLNGEALTLMELGELYSSWEDNPDRYEQAATCYRQAAERYTTLTNTFHEGQARCRLAETMFSLGEISDVRQELERALVCQASHDHTAEPWKTWALLMEVERKQGHPEAVHHAREEAATAYLSYRRDGGEALFPGGRLCEQVATILSHGKKAMVLLERLKAATLVSNSRHELHTLLSRLQEIVAGSHDPILANDPTLHYSDIAELRLLLERLA